MSLVDLWRSLNALPDLMAEQHDRDILAAHEPEDVFGDRSKLVCMHFLCRKWGKPLPDWPCQRYAEAFERLASRA